MFPDNEFWQCPSYTWSSFLLSLVVSIIIALAMLGGQTSVQGAQLVCGLMVLFWMGRTMMHWFSPDARCEAKGFPGQHYANPFYRP